MMSVRLSAAEVVAGSNRIAFPRGDGDWLYWQECLSDNQNRWVVRRALVSGGSVETLTPPDKSVTTKIHEYGGIGYGVKAGRLVWIDGEDHAVILTEGGRHRRLFQDDDWRFGEPLLCARGVILVGECAAGGSFPDNLLVLIDWQGRLERVHEGEDFYAAPTLDGREEHLAWVSWNLPDMPWQRSRLWRGCWAGDFSPTLVIDAPGQMVFQPEFDADGRLHHVDDRSGFGQLYRDDLLIGEAGLEHGLPLWQLGMRSYALTGDGGAVLTAADRGVWGVYCCDRHGVARGILEGFDEAHVADPVAVGSGVAVLVMPPDAPPRLVYCGKEGQRTVHALTTAIPATAMVCPESHLFPGSAGSVQGYLYRPPGLRRPPVILKNHGGPSGQTTPAWNLKTAFWVSNGFAVFDINYSGSTGFGRDYLERLDGEWGVLDVQDCLAGLDYLVEAGLVDEGAVFVSGSSAGGLTTLGCLIASNRLAGGVCAYGVADLEGLARMTHKFEAKYLDSLVGVLPEAEAVYRARSPLYHAGRIDCPVLFLQGGKDVVVPREQTARMIEAIRAQPDAPVCELVEFPDEGHGFRQPDNIQAALEAELAFYRSILSRKRRV